MDAKEAFKIMFGFDLLNFEEVYENSCISSFVGTLEEVRKMKSAFEYFKKAFNWEENFFIYKYDAFRYIFKSEDFFVSSVQLNNVEKIE